ncbi:MAG: two-component system, OmpR family, sensor histidine kinase SenX3 [Frankiaceae bacterium]|nr:two-component system, OmpR family, sensor histidine kinase SenX3 [Frankiaceae bacterium]
MLSGARRRTGGRTHGETATGATRLPLGLLDEVPVAVVALRGDDVVFANAAAHRLGIVRGTFLVVAELRQTARLVRRDGLRREITLTLPSAQLSPTRIPVRAEVFLLGGDEVGAVVEDQTEASRVEAVRRDFVANVGHEVKTPVGAIALLAEALKEARDDPVAVARFVDRIAVETQRLSRLVQELLDLSRLQGGEPLPEMTVIGVDAVVNEVVERMSPMADAKQVRLVVDGESGLAVLGDAGQLAMALANLIDNAISYSAPGSRVALTAKCREDVVELVVADQGVGIAHVDLVRVFERFYRVDPARSRETGGTGLGLAIVKHVMNNHGGEVTVWSTPGVGSTFTLRLPEAAAADGGGQPG